MPSAFVEKLFLYYLSVLPFLYGNLGVIFFTPFLMRIIEMPLHHADIFTDGYF